jgi:hypothetical protein
VDEAIAISKVSRQLLLEATRNISNVGLDCRYKPLHLDLGELMGTPPPGVDVAIAISKVWKLS